MRHFDDNTDLLAVLLLVIALYFTAWQPKGRAIQVSFQEPGKFLSVQRL